MSKTLLLAVVFSLFAVGLSNTRCFFETRNASSWTSCVRMNVSAVVGVRYAKTDDKVGYMSLQIPCTNNGSRVQSQPCNTSATTTSLTIQWGRINETEDYLFSIMFEFVQNGKEWNISSIAFDGDGDAFDNAKSEAIYANITDKIIGKPKTGRSYQCNSKNNLTLTSEPSEKEDFNVSVALRDFQVQAFDFKANKTYGSVSRCSQDIKGSKIVPIAVGAALAGLVVIVLIAYIIGRLRSRRQSSYEALS